VDIGVWKKIGEGDRAAYGQLYAYYYKRLYNYGKKFTDSEPLIEDTVQEIFMHFWQQRHKILQVDNPQSYFFYSFRNKLFQKLKQETKKDQAESTLSLDPEFNIESILISDELAGEKRQALHQAMQALPSRQREIIFLRFYEGLSYDQISETMNITINSTYKTMTKALHHLRQTMQLPISSILFLLISHR